MSRLASGARRVMVNALTEYGYYVPHFGCIGAVSGAVYANYYIEKYSPLDERVGGTIIGTAVGGAMGAVTGGLLPVIIPICSVAVPIAGITHVVNQKGIPK
jgi:hypothetical protein